MSAAWKYIKWPFADRWGVRLWVIVVGIVAAVALLVAGLVLGARTADRHYSQKSCDAYADLNEGLEIQWVDLTFWDYGCYVRIDGVLVSTDSYRATVDGSHS